LKFGLMNIMRGLGLGVGSYDFCGCAD